MYINSVNTDLPLNRNSKLPFRALSPDIIKNQMKIYLCQDIFAEKLKVKMPETELEKEVLLEVLQNRLHLDRLTRLANEKFRLKAKIDEAVSLLENDPDNPKLDELRAELAKKGNLEAVVETMSKTIEKEKKMKKSAVDYFADIRSLEEEYLNKRYVSVSKIDRFIKSVKNGNINKDGKYSTQELIDIITNKDAQDTQSEPKNVIKKAKAAITKNRFLEILTSHYEDYLRNNINIYRGKSGSVDMVRPLANSYLIEKFSEYFNKFPEVKKSLDKICLSLKRKFGSKVDRFKDVSMFNLEKALVNMDSIMARIKQLLSDINKISSDVNITPEKRKLLLEEKEVRLKKEKEEWLDYLDAVVKAEEENRERVRAVGCEDEYDYLVAKNKTINGFKELHKVFKENNGTLPDDVWKTILE